MSTEQVTKSTDGQPTTVPQKFNDWNNKHFQIDSRMARKMRFEREEYLKKNPGKAVVRSNRPLPTLPTPPTGKVDTTKTTAPKSTGQQSTGQQGTAPKTTTVPQLPPVPKLPDDVRRKAILARLEALKGDLARAGKVKGDTDEARNLLGEMSNAKANLMVALQKPNYDAGEAEIAELEKVTGKLCFLESKARSRSVEKAFGDSVTGNTPARTRLTKEVEGAIQDSSVYQLNDAVGKAFNETVVKEYEDSTGADDSKLGVVTAAMRAVATEQTTLSSGTGGNIGALRKAVKDLETAAQTYIKDHKNALSKEGKARVAAAKTMLDTAQSALKIFAEAEAKAQAAIDKVRACDPANLTPKMISSLNDLGEAKYVSAALKSTAQFEAIESKKRLDKFEDARLLQLATTLEKMNVNDRSGSMVNALEAELANAGKQRTVEGSVKTKVEAVIKAARTELAQQAQKLLSDPSLDSQQKAEIMISRCGAKPPKGKGESDSFFVNGPDGKPAYIFKPQKGENSKFGEEGAGVARELLTGKFNDVMKNAVPGLDFGISPTTVARLDSESLSAGTLSKETNRMGALQQAIPNEGSLTDLFNKDPSKLATIPDDDVQKIAILDFITLQADRNCDNLLIQEDSTGAKRLKPIDGGFAFPPTDMFKTYGGGMCANGKAGPNRAMVPGENAVTQLPQSDKPFTPAVLKMIADMKPDQIVASMKQANTDMENGAPELKGMVDPSAFDNVGKSIKFLQKAAKELTPAQLAEVYALSFGQILEASDSDIDSLMDEVVGAAKKKPAFDAEMTKRDDEYKKLGGDAELKKLGWPVETDMALKLDLKRKIEILKNPGANQPPPQQPEPQVPDFNQRYVAAGGDDAVKKMNKAGDMSATLGDNVEKRMAAIEAFTKYTAVGGDKELKKLSARKDPRIKPWKETTADKLRAIEDYQALAKDGAEYDRLGGDAKYDLLQKKFRDNGFTRTAPVAKRLNCLQLSAEYDGLGGDAAFFRFIRKYRADATTLFENLDAPGKKIALGFAKFKGSKWLPEDEDSLIERVAIMKICT